jgi:uncharacterized repeat protein (TIGR01451 family)
VKTLLRVWLRLVVLLVALAPAPVPASTPAGTVISNTASLGYSDLNGFAQTVQSNTVSATVAAVSAVAVGPKEQGCSPQTDSVEVRMPFTRTYTVTNGGNIPDTYTVTAAATTGTVTALAVLGASGSTTPVQNGGTLPQIAPGAALQVQVTVNPGVASAGTDIEVTLTATSTAATSPGSDSAQQCAVLANSAQLSGPGGAGTPILKLVNGQPFAAAAAGATISYSVQFMNSGQLPANEVVVTDAVPAGIVPQLSSLMLNGAAPPAGAASLNGQTLTVAIPTLAPGAAEVVTFNALVSSTLPLGQTYVNTVTVAASATPAERSTPASVLVGVGNIVYDGLGGGSLPLAGATVTLEDSSGKTLTLSGKAFPPNTGNANPYATGATGAYAFGLGANQLGPASYQLDFAAPGYLNRRVGLTLTPNAAGTLYDVTIASLDGQLLATPGGFSLVKGPVTLANVYGSFGNLPLFRAQNIALSDAVDRPFASSGDRLVYTVTFSDISTPLGPTSVVDTLPAGVFYAPGSGRLDGLREEPKVSGRLLSWSLPSLAVQHVITFAAVIAPGLEENLILSDGVGVSAHATNDPAVTVSASASAQTQIVAGVFTDRTIVTGRVFYDLRQTGDFQPGDAGIGGVRIYLEDGESVVTDSTGRYDFPGVGPGMHVLRLDTASLPPGAKPYDDRSLAWDDQRSIRRLVHGVFDGGVIENIDFALEGSP